MPRLRLGDWVDSGVNWPVAHMSWVFDAIRAVVEGMYDAIDGVLTAPAPLLLAGILAVLARWPRGVGAGVLAFAGFALVDSLDLWDRAMSTLALVLVATLIALVVSVPLGIWAARSKAVSATVRPVLDLLQTMPSMVLLIPAILFFGLGTAAGVTATLIFALAPGVRMTELGIRQVDAEPVEAAEAFGTTPRDTLLRVQLPLALPTIMAGVNQVIMLGLSMVVIAGMVGTGGLGGAVNEAIGRLDIGFGFEAGVGIVVLALVAGGMGVFGSASDSTDLADDRFHTAVATSTDLRVWTRRHDFGAGTSQPSLHPDGTGGWVLAYEKDPANHIALRHCPDLAALLAGRSDRAFDAPRTLSGCAEGTPDLTAVRGDTVELTGHYRAGCATDRQLRATLWDFTHWQARPDHRLDQALLAWGTAGNIGDRSRIALMGRPLVLIEGQCLRNDFGSWSTYAYDPVSGRADRVGLRTPGGSGAFANPSAALITDPDGRPALLVSVFIPKEESAPGESGERVYWREL